jgi:hypothetical protein
MHREEHLMDEILHVPLSDAQAPERAPDVSELELEQRPKVDRRRVWLRDAILDLRTSPVLDASRRDPSN